MTISRKYCTCFSPYHSDGLDELILAHSRKVVVPACRYYVTPGDPLTELSYNYSGESIHSIVNLNGQEKVSYILSHGWFLAENVFTSFPEGSTKEAERFSYSLTELVLLKINRSQFQILCQEALFREAFIHSLGYKKAYLQHEIECLALSSCRDRLKNFFAVMADSSVCLDLFWHPLTRDYTHRDIAAILGTNRVTVSRLISDLASEGFLRIVNKKVQISSRAVSSFSHASHT